ncbi:hypothetical protein PMAYCL1PPCAC_20475, partial [Pristionchus mayeri]
KKCFQALRAVNERTRTVTFNVPPEGSLGLCCNGSFVKQVLEGGPSHANGVRRGDQIISIDGFHVDSPHLNEMFAKCKENGRITLVLRYNPESLRDLEEAQKQVLKSTTDKEDPTIRTVTITKQETGDFGLSNIGTSISAVVEGGPAHTQGVLRGDQILSIDGVSVEKLSNELIAVLFGKANVMGKITLEVRHNPERLRDLER